MANVPNTGSYAGAFELIRDLLKCVQNVRNIRNTWHPAIGRSRLAAVMAAPGCLAALSAANELNDLLKRTMKAVEPFVPRLKSASDGVVPFGDLCDPLATKVAMRYAIRTGRLLNRAWVRAGEPKPAVFEAEHLPILAAVMGEAWIPSEGELNQLVAKVEREFWIATAQGAHDAQRDDVAAGQADNDGPFGGDGFRRQGASNQPAPEMGGLPTVDAAKDAIDAGDDQADLTPQERALGLLVTHSDWTDVKIADAVGVSRTTLYKPSWAKYQNARAALKAGRGEMARGQKDANSGQMEAWSDDTE